MSEPQETRTPHRFRITSIIVTCLMLAGAFGILIGPLPINVSANPTAITYGGAGTLDQLWMNNGLVNFTFVDGYYSWVSLYAGMTGHFNHVQGAILFNATYTQTTSYSQYNTYTSYFQDFTDAYGTGKTCVVAYSSPKDARPSTAWYFSLYEDRPLFTWQAKITSSVAYNQNVSAKTDYSAASATGGLLVGDTTAHMHYFIDHQDTGSTEPYWFGPYPSSLDFGVGNAYWAMGDDQLGLITSSAEDISFTFGALTTNHSAISAHVASTIADDKVGGIKTFTISSNTFGDHQTISLRYLLMTGSTMWSEKQFGCFQMTTNPNEAFEVYSDYRAAIEYQKPLINSAVWGSWYEYWTNYNATIINQTAFWLTVNHPEVKYMIFDMGLEYVTGARTMCDSTNINTTKFPNFKSVIDYVHSLGLNVILWFAPLMGTDMKTAHPSWAAVNGAGIHLTQTVGGGNYDYMDYSQAAVRNYIANFSTNMTNLYSIDGYKFDFSISGQLVCKPKDWNYTLFQVQDLLYGAINASASKYLEICQTMNIWTKYANAYRMGLDQNNFANAISYLVGISALALSNRNGNLGATEYDMAVGGVTAAQNRSIATIGAMVGVPISWLGMNRNWTNIAKDFIDLSISRKDLWIVDASMSYTGRLMNLPPRILLLNQSLFGGTGQYTLGVINVENAQRTFNIDLTDAAPAGFYWAYNVWNETAWMVDSSSFDITLGAYDSALVSLTPISLNNILWSDGKVNSYGAEYANIDGRYGDETIVVAHTNHIWTNAIVYSTVTDLAVQFTSSVSTGTTVNLTALSGTLDVTPDAGMVISTVTDWASDSKKWITDPGTGTPVVTFTLSGLESGRMYRLYIDGTSSQLLTASGGGVISFTYSGPWSEHQFEIVATSITASISPLINLIFVMFAIGIVIGVVVEGTQSIRKQKQLTTDQMLKSLINMVLYIIIGLLSISVLYSMVA